MDLSEGKDEFFNSLEKLIDENDITLDRLKGSSHPVFTDFVYLLDYGFINNTKSQDGGGIDVFVGSSNTGLVGILCTIDMFKKDSEIKVLFNCSDEDVCLAVEMMTNSFMKCVLVKR